MSFSSRVSIMVVVFIFWCAESRRASGSIHSTLAHSQWHSTNTCARVVPWKCISSRGPTLAKLTTWTPPRLSARISLNLFSTTRDENSPLCQHAHLTNARVKLRRKKTNQKKWLREKGNLISFLCTFYFAAAQPLIMDRINELEILIYIFLKWRRSFFFAKNPIKWIEVGLEICFALLFLWWMLWVVVWNRK